MADMKSHRTALGVTQAEMATLLGVHWITVSKWERGVNSVPPRVAEMADHLSHGARAQPALREEVPSMLCEHGRDYTVYRLLSAYFTSIGLGASQ